MDMRKKSDGELMQGKFQVRDPFSIMVLILLSILIYGISVIGLASAKQPLDFIVGAVFSMTVGVLVAMRLRAIWRGIEFDFSERTLAFPGGGLRQTHLEITLN